MRIYYFDDSGFRKFTPGSPFFVLGGFGVDANQIPSLNNKLKNVARSYGMTLEYPNELKFNQVGRQKDNKPSKPHWMLRSGISEMNKRRALVYSCLRILCRTPSAEVLSVAIDMRNGFKSNPIEAAVEPLLERVHLNSQKYGAKALVLMDEEQASDKFLRESMRGGSAYLGKYSNILDTICFMPSEESGGIQLADLIAGGISRYLNNQDPGYIRTFLNAVAKSETGSVNGYGIKIYPHGAFSYPAPRLGAWTPTDKEVHQHECDAYDGLKLTWNWDSPSVLWTDDWDYSSTESAAKNL